MATELLKDSRDNVLGSIETGDDGGQVLRDAKGSNWGQCYFPVSLLLR